MHCFFIGDSFINGVGDIEGLGWRGRAVAAAMKSGVDLTAYDLGVRRHTSADIHSRWRSEAEARLLLDTDHHFLFAFGANDCASSMGSDGSIDLSTPRLHQDETLSNASTLLVEAASLGPVIVIGPCPILDDEAADQRIANLEPRLADLAKRKGVPFLPVFDWCRGNKAWTSGAAKGDGTHPDSSGYAALAEHILKWEKFRQWIGISSIGP